eukprot:175433-Rhodomonas_salina.1
MPPASEPRASCRTRESRKRRAREQSERAKDWYATARGSSGGVRGGIKRREIDDVQREPRCGGV